MSLPIDFLFIGIGTGAAYAVLGVSFAIIFRVTGILHFAHGAIFSIAALVFVLLTATDGLPAVAALAVSIVLAALLGSIVYFFGYRPLERRRATLLSTFVTSLGILIVAQSVLSLLFGPNDRFGTVETNLATPLFQHGAIFLRGIDVASVAVALGVLLILALVWKRTRIGLILQALESNRSLAEDLNIPYERFALVAFALGSALCAVSAVMYSLSLSVSPYVGTPMLLNAFVAMVIGGTGSIWASAVGGLLLGIAQKLPLVWLNGSWIDAVSFGLLFAVLLIAPQGVVNIGWRRALRKPRSATRQIDGADSQAVRAGGT